MPCPRSRGASCGRRSIERAAPAGSRTCRERQRLAALRGGSSGVGARPETRARVANARSRRPSVPRRARGGRAYRARSPSPRWKTSLRPLAGLCRDGRPGDGYARLRGLQRRVQAVARTWPAAEVLHDVRAAGRFRGLSGALAASKPRARRGVQQGKTRREAEPVRLARVSPVAARERGTPARSPASRLAPPIFPRGVFFAEGWRAGQAPSPHGWGGGRRTRALIREV